MSDAVLIGIQVVLVLGMAFFVWHIFSTKHTLRQSMSKRSETTMADRRADFSSILESTYTVRQKNIDEIKRIKKSLDEIDSLLKNGGRGTE